MIKIVNGKKMYGNKVVLKDINYNFYDKNMYVITGPNGSGKTLLIKSIVGYIKLTEGSVYQNEVEIRKNNNYIKNAGIIIENPQMVNEFTVKENLEYLKKMSKNRTEINLEYWYNFFEIEDFINVKFKNLSLGTKQKVALIQAFMHNPENLILDEPFNALDKDMARKVEDYLIEQRDKGKLIIIVTHINDNIINKCDKVLEISEGKIKNYE